MNLIVVCVFLARARGYERTEYVQGLVVVDTLIQDGNFEVLKKFCSAYKEHMLKNIELGLNSDNLDFHLNYLLDVIEFCLTLQVLSLQFFKSDDIPEKEKSFFYHLNKRYDEILATLVEPFSWQIQDFNGDVWQLVHQRNIEHFKSLQSENAVNPTLPFCVPKSIKTAIFSNTA